MGAVPFYLKTPDADYTIALDFADQIPTATPPVTLESVECSARKHRDETDVTGTLLAGGTDCTVLSGSTVGSINVSAGVRGTLYEILFTPTLSDGQVLPATIARLMVDE